MVSPNSGVGACPRIRKAGRRRIPVTEEGRVTSTARFVGVDIPKADFVVACRPAGTSWTALNDVPGITDTVARVRALAPTIGPRLQVGPGVVRPRLRRE